MTADAVIVTAGAATAYMWLCAVVAPLAFAFNRLISTRGAGRAWLVMALATGGCLLWSTVAAGLILLGIVLVPSVGLALLLSSFTIAGVSLGVTVWGFQTLVTARLPRLGPAFELDTALALVLLVKGDARSVVRLERVYAAFLIDEAPEALRSGDVYRVPA
jgi:hypothetical protein